MEGFLLWERSIERPRLWQNVNKGRGVTGAGLDNLGNTCFLNAILQCLTHTVPLVERLRLPGHSNSCSRAEMNEFCSLCALKDHIEESLKKSGDAISAASFVENLTKISSDFRRGHPEDAHECLHCLLDKLHQCCLDTDAEEESHIKQVFGGRTRSQVRCCDCGHTMDTYGASTRSQLRD